MYLQNSHQCLHMIEEYEIFVVKTHFPFTIRTVKTKVHYPIFHIHFLFNLRLYEYTLYVLLNKLSISKKIKFAQATQLLRIYKCPYWYIFSKTH